MAMKGNSEKYKKELVEVLYKTAKNKKLLEDFLGDILTPGEFETIASRWQIVKRLAKGDRQQNIAKELGLGIATVTRGSREIKDKKGGFRKVLKLLKLI